MTPASPRGARARHPHPFLCVQPSSRAPASAFACVPALRTTPASPRGAPLLRVYLRYVRRRRLPGVHARSHEHDGPLHAAGHAARHAADVADAAVGAGVAARCDRYAGAAAIDGITAIALRCDASAAADDANADAVSGRNAVAACHTAAVSGCTAGRLPRGAAVVAASSRCDFEASLGPVALRVCHRHLRPGPRHQCSDSRQAVRRRHCCRRRRRLLLQHRRRPRRAAYVGSASLTPRVSRGWQRRRRRIHAPRVERAAWQRERQHERVDAAAVSGPREKLPAQVNGKLRGRQGEVGGRGFGFASAVETLQCDLGHEQVGWGRHPSRGPMHARVRELEDVVGVIAKIEHERHHVLAAVAGRLRGGVRGEGACACTVGRLRGGVRGEDAHAHAQWAD
eukprot:366385-Chlamydomonas_euryale.AAC.6